MEKRYDLECKTRIRRKKHQAGIGIVLYQLYSKNRVRECRRIPNADKYYDGTHSDAILILISL